MRPVVRRLALLPLLLALLVPALPATPARASGPALAPELVVALDRALAAVRADTGAPGALLYINIPGRGTYSGASGLADVTTQTPLAPGAQVRVASLTKPFVAVVAMQLVQEGWLLLDHSVAQWLPGLVPGGERITVRQLLSHRSGLPDYLADGFVARAYKDPGRVWRPEELVAEGLRRPRSFVPGAPGRWEYSNTNYILLGMIVERVTGNALEHELRQRIVEPLGLRGTALAAPSAPAGSLAHGYVRGVDYTGLSVSVGWAAGGLTSTPDDLGRFMGALVGGELLGPAALAAMLDFAGTGGAWGVPDLAYGLGVMRRTLPASGIPAAARLAVGHTGSLGGYRTAMWHLPGSGVTVVAALTRQNADPGRLVARALETLAAHGALGAP